VTDVTHLALDALVLAALLVLEGCSTWVTKGSLWRGRLGACETHVGARPASDGPSDWAMTVQVTTDYPRCPR